MDETTPDPKRISLNQTEAARALGVTDRTLRNWDRRGIIKGRRLGGRLVLYDVEELRRLMSGNWITSNDQSPP